MASLILPLDTPTKASLQSQAANLRTSLKDFEKQYTSEHDGRKPGKDVIKADAALAARYKEYNKVRDVLDGKIGIEVLHTTSSNRRKSSHSEAEALNSKLQQHSVERTPRTRRVHPNDFDPYDPPLSTSPKATFLSAIGPTPQRDGQILGIFDALFNSGSGRFSQATPSSKKRKRDALHEVDNNGQDTINIAQTPSQRATKHKGDLLDFLAGETPSSGSAKGRHKLSRTPASEGKKFMLSQFFETPSAARYANIVQSPDKTISRGATVDQTPLRTRVLGLTPVRHSGDQPAPDATPAYLKRSFSFKDRLLSVTGTGSQSRTSSLEVPKTTHRSRSIRNTSFMPKPLSQVVSDLQNMEEQQYDDDLDALREMEDNNNNVLVGDSPRNNDDEIPSQQTEDPTRIWKKKGQKRTTRRSIMRPTKMKTKKENKFVDVQDEYESDENVGEEDNQQKEDGGDVSRVEETQLQRTTKFGSPNSWDDEFEDDLEPLDEPPMKQRRAARPSHLDPREDNGDEDYDDESNSRQEGNTRSASDHRSKTLKSSHPPQNSNSQSFSKDASNQTKAAEAKKKKTPGTINPNAHSHMNFRSLKIRNKNSRAKGAGRGRFGRRR